MKARFTYLFRLVFLITAIPIQAQDSTQFKKHSINFELAGRSIIWGSLNYEFQPIRQLAFGAGFGLVNLESGTAYKEVDGVMQTGRYMDVQSTQKLYFNYLLGKGKNQLLFTSGVTHFLANGRRTFNTQTDWLFDSQIRWNVGVGYQYSKNRVLFRATAYAIRMPEPVGWFPRVFPWIGLTVGYRF